jgi:hypothetical protein
VTVGIAVNSIVILALCRAIAHGFKLMRFAEEDARATQILLQKTETIRLCSWDQIGVSGFIPSTFTVPYDPQQPSSGNAYTGTVSLANAPLGTPYAQDVKQLDIHLNWTTASVAHHRQVTTFIARHGLQTDID